MAKLVLEEQPEFLTFPEDSILDLKVEEVDIRTVNGARGDWQKIEFKFKILGIQAIGDGSPKENYEGMITQTIWGSVPARFTNSPENKLRQWAEALFAMELGVGFELDTDMFVGRQCRGVTSTYDKKFGDQVSKRHQVESLLPKAGAASPVASGAPVAAATAAPTPAPSQADPWGTNWGAAEPPF